MSDPATAVAGGVVAGAAGLSIAGFLAGVDGNALAAAVCGALVFVMTRRDLDVLTRGVFFFVSVVMGYLFSPALTDLELWGIRPFAYSGPAAFVAAALSVTLIVAAITKRGSPQPPAQGGNNG